MLYRTHPGATGLVLIILVLITHLTMLKSIIKNCYEIYSNSFLFFYLFVIMLVIHGLRSWFNFGKKYFFLI